MTILVAGTVRVPPSSLEAFRPHMLAMLAATRAEDGCIDYAYSLDAAEPGLVRVFEMWRDRVALDAHFQTEHLARWRAAWPQFGVSDRRLTVYEIAGEYSL